MSDQLAAAPGAASGRESPTWALTTDFLQWLAGRPRPYAEVMEAWRTSCPRLTVWEDAADAGYVTRRSEPGGPVVALTAAGLERLRAAA